MKTEMWTWMRVQFFRFWTALVVLGAYGYFWLNTPEYLTAGFLGAKDTET